MLETIDGGATAADSRALKADTSWEPDFEEPDFKSNGVVPNIISPSDSAVECHFDNWALSDNEMEAISEYNKEPLSDAPPPPPEESEETARTTNVKTLKTSSSPVSSEGKQRQSQFSKAKQKYRKYVQSPKDAKKKKELEIKEREEARSAAAKRRERIESKKDKFKKMVKYKSNTPPQKTKALSDSNAFDPWLEPSEAAPKEEEISDTPKEEEVSDAPKEVEVSDEWEPDAEWGKDEEQDDDVKDDARDDEIIPHTPVQKVSSDVKSQDIFRPKGAPVPPVAPSPADKEITDVLKDVQQNLEVSAITKSSSLLYDDESSFEYEFNLDSTPINVRDRDFQSKIDEKIADDAPETVSDPKDDEVAEEPGAPPAGKMAFFTCGTLEVEFPSPKQVMVDFTRDLKTGMRNSVRSFFGQCDVGEGADVVAANVHEAKKSWKENVNASREHNKDYVGFGFKKE